MVYIFLFLAIVLISCFFIPFFKGKYKGILAITSILALSLISSILAIDSLLGQNTSLILYGSSVTGKISIVIDSLSAWFILIINFTFITGSIYGSKYMEAYLDKPKNLSFHWINLILFHAAMLAVTVLQNFIAFLFAWEIMAVSAFFMVIFEGHKQKTIKAGINYLIQSHVAIILLSLGFIWISSVTSSFDFKSISEFVATKSPQTSLVLMLIFFIGFGIKAGFVPFHTWLPHAHPVAPSHVSGIMSGVLIKIGIYGILRMVFLFNTNYLVFGYLMLGISILTGVYGVMLAIVQHDLKRLLAYHSIENIGIIGIGIGLRCIDVLLARLGFAGALLHTLNHSLFKSLLFYSAGNVYQSIHSMHIDGLGGLIKKMPHTAFLFLIAALAICGLPPFNGFISEFIIYTGLFNGILSSGFPQILAFVASIFSLSIIGGLAILCFTKAFGIVFLGTPRQHLDFHPVEKNWRRIFPMYLIVILIVAIGTFPQAFEGLLSMPVNLLSLKIPNASTGISLNLEMAASIGFYSLGLKSKYHRFYLGMRLCWHN